MVRLKMMLLITKILLSIKRDFLSFQKLNEIDLYILVYV